MKGFPRFRLIWLQSQVLLVPQGPAFFGKKEEKEKTKTSELLGIERGCSMSFTRDEAVSIRQVDNLGPPLKSLCSPPHRQSIDASRSSPLAPSCHPQSSASLHVVLTHPECILALASFCIKLSSASFICHGKTRSPTLQQSHEPNILPHDCPGLNLNAITPKLSN